jgi:hypothetical protein
MGRGKGRWRERKGGGRRGRWRRRWGGWIPLLMARDLLQILGSLLHVVSTASRPSTPPSRPPRRRRLEGVERPPL